MSQFLIYEVKAALILTAFYLGFKLFLSSEKMHRFNRLVLLLSCLGSFVLPLCIITVHRALPLPEIVENVEDLSAPAASGEEAGRSIWEYLLISIYWLGVSYVLARTMAGVISVLKLIKSCRCHITPEGDELMISDADIPPFSWMKWIVMSSKDLESGNRHILEHEKAHVRLRHSLDVLLMDLISAFQWFNPTIWLLRRDLRAIHEFEADDSVLKGGADIKEYQYSLIRKAVSASGYSITNSFNHSIFKNRITMMSKPKASVMRGLKVLYIIPLICGSLALNARTVVDYSGNVSDDKVSESPANQQQNVVPDERPKFNGGDANEFAKWVMDNLYYPEEAKRDSLSGRVMVGFTVGKDGKVANVKVLRGVCESLDKEALRVVQASPDWTPGKKDGEAIDVTFTFPVEFRIKK
ncbi:MAG: M56 family metallopeptidase [Candidatus Cryptobacteroides sp.]|nr:M56 family metallopeptidase [Rikenellaceae bacterium]MDY5745942.1 M56 family metallopeptidase [Candidatus Cryptobacteroides sp.]